VEAVGEPLAQQEDQPLQKPRRDHRQNDNQSHAKNGSRDGAPADGLENPHLAPEFTHIRSLRMDAHSPRRNSSSLMREAQARSLQGR
jgi:hypothetical protein